MTAGQIGGARNYMDDSAHGTTTVNDAAGPKQKGWVGDDEALPVPKQDFEPEVNDSTYRVGQGASSPSPLVGWSV